MLVCVLTCLYRCARVLDELCKLLVTEPGLRQLQALLHGRASEDRVAPLLHRGPGTEIDSQQDATAPHPADAADVGDRVLVAGEVGALLQSDLQHIEEALRLVEIALLAVFGFHGRKEDKVVGLACFQTDNVSSIFPSY